MIATITRTRRTTAQTIYTGPNHVADSRPTPKLPPTHRQPGHHRPRLGRGGGRRQGEARTGDREPRRLGARHQLLRRRQVPVHQLPRQDGQGLGPRSRRVDPDLPGAPGGGLRRRRPGRRQGRLFGRRRPAGPLVERRGQGRRQARPQLRRPRRRDLQVGPPPEREMAHHVLGRQDGPDLERGRRQERADTERDERLRL